MLPISFRARGFLRLLILACALGAAAPARAQIGTGDLFGVIRDQAGASVPGASVVAVSVQTNRQRAAFSDRSGGYRVSALAPGLYRVDVRLAGFKTLRREGIRIAVGEQTRLDLELTVGDLSEHVIVSGDAAALRGPGAGLGSVVAHEQVVQLPLDGRTFVTLASLAPGVLLPPNSQLPRINGGRPRTNEYLFDGISVLQPEPGQVAFFPVVDAIQEFKVDTNSAPAEFGRFNGGVVNLTTKSGSNALRGTGFEFMRHEALNARNVFQAEDTAKPEYRRNQFGGTIGGPLVRDRTFFFADYQGQQRSIARTVISTVPTLLQREGRFTEPIGGQVPAIYDPATTALAGGRFTRMAFAGNEIPANRMDPVARALLDALPASHLGGHGEQLPADRNRNRRPEPVGCARWTSVSTGGRPVVRPALALRRSVHPGHAAP